ncbi:hypothetical protein BDV95DRAFT_648028, partial [Massariosphaeria phaeospora]
AYFPPFTHRTSVGGTPCPNLRRRTQCTPTARRAEDHPANIKTSDGSLPAESLQRRLHLLRDLHSDSKYLPLEPKYAEIYARAIQTSQQDSTVWLLCAIAAGARSAQPPRERPRERPLGAPVAAPATSPHLLHHLHSDSKYLRFEQSCEIYMRQP